MRITHLTIRVAAMVALTAAALALAGCSQKGTEQFRDAPRTGPNVTTPMEVHDAPDGFSNWAEGCDGHGNRVFVIFHNDNPYGSVFALKDATCPTG